ncbi:MAG: hypothetical protein ACK5UJ_00265 [Pseudobdellovibrionaceae bacterium]|nr:hypothetical protein [Pseudanabaena sp. M151S2SP2A07QC]
MRKLLLLLKRLFKKPQQALPKPPPVTTPAEPIKPLPPVEAPKPLLDLWTKQALEISQSFEGSDPWANITGNFDGAGLTCGALGWTIKWNNQQRLVKDFVKAHGLSELMALMPKTGNEYWKITKLPEEAALAEVNAWSRGQSKVLQPYREELRAFWKDERMKDIQVKYAEADMGTFAMRQAQATQSYFKLQEPKFHHFAYWFDQAVLNGTGKTPSLVDGEKFTLKDVLEWMQSETGYAQGDFKKNHQLWSKERLDVQSLHLLKLAMVRAQRSREQFDTVTMNRRGTLAVKKGYVNGTLRDLTNILS